MMRTGLFYWWAVVLVAAADQLTKQLIMSYIPYQEMVDLLPCLALVHVYNTGAAFSFLSQSGGWQAYLFIAIALVALIIIGVSLARIPRRQWVYCLSLALIAGGAVGNVIDRICYGHVVDFILFYIIMVFPRQLFDIFRIIQALTLGFQVSLYLLQLLDPFLRGFRFLLYLVNLIFLTS